MRRVERQNEKIASISKPLAYFLWLQRLAEYNLLQA